MADRHVFDPVPPEEKQPPGPKRPRLPRREIVTACAAAAIVVAVVIALRTPSIAEGPTGALMALRCGACAHTESRRTLDPTACSCAKCGKGMGYDVACLPCGHRFAFAPTRDESGMIALPKCAKCGSLNVLPAIPASTEEGGSR